MKTKRHALGSSKLRRGISTLFAAGYCALLPSVAGAAGSFFTTTTPGNVNFRGYATMEDVAKIACNQSAEKKANYPWFACGGIVYFKHAPEGSPPNAGHTNYWWGYYYAGNGPYPYYAIDYEPDVPPTAKNLNPSCSAGMSVGNPVNQGLGEKFQKETDYRNQSGLDLTRFYHSSSFAPVGSFGTSWRHTYDRKISTLDSGLFRFAYLTRAAGEQWSYQLTAGTWVSDGDVNDVLVELKDGSDARIGWQYTTGDASVETYSASGQLLSIRDRSGLTQTLIYSDTTTPVSVAPRAGLLIRVTDSFGKTLNFTYDANARPSSMVDPAGGNFTYSYDAANNLAGVTFPDGKTRQYLYNEQNYTSNTELPTALTGIIDEKGVRYATYQYNAAGKAISTEHAGGVDRYQLSYTTDAQGNPLSTSVTDPLGSIRTSHFTRVQGVIRNMGSDQPAGAGCAGASTLQTYDANGNVATRTDVNGVLTSYTYDVTRNLETSRTEAVGTPQARTITTSWHPSLRLPLKIAEPKRLTIFTYDVAGNTLTKSERATTDATGAAGLAASVTGVARTSTFTYNSLGQVLTADGPRTDVMDKTIYSYDATGNLRSITNALGHAATLDNYDAHGHVGRVIDPNGVVTDLTYTPRGWLRTMTVTSGATIARTTYVYDGVGQITKVTLPDGSFVSYTYDAAHRLTGVKDSLGNSMKYTLNNLGQRLGESVKDPNGLLQRQITRTFDALNRIQQATGAIR